MFLFLLVAILSLILLLRNRQIHSFFESYKLAKTIQGPPLTKWFPLIGSLQFVGLNAGTFLIAFGAQFPLYWKIISVQVQALHEKYSKYYAHGFRIWAFGKLIYVTYEADDVEAILRNPKNIRKGFTYQFLHTFLGDGLLLSYGKKWFQRRKILTPSFHHNILRKFQPSMKNQTKILIDTLKKEEKNNENGTNLQEVLSRYTLNLICKTAMGVNVSEANALDEYLRQIHELADIIVERSITPWTHLNALYRFFGKWQEEKKLTGKVHKFTRDIIASRNEFPLEDSYSNDIISKQRHAMLDTLLIVKKHGFIDTVGIQEEVDTFIFAGYDTTMTAITFTLFMIAHHPDVQNKLYEEIVSNYDDRNIDINQRNQMKYLDCVIKESLRLFAPVPLLGRLLGDETVISGTKLPVGTNVHILISALHRDPKHFERPNKFEPDRFTLENSKNRHPFAYIPFSALHRNCIGQKFAMLQLKMVIPEIIKNFRLEPLTTIEEVTFKCGIILQSKDPIRIRFVSR